MRVANVGGDVEPRMSPKRGARALDPQSPTAAASIGFHVSPFSEEKLPSANRCRASVGRGGVERRRPTLEQLLAGWQGRQIARTAGCLSRGGEARSSTLCHSSATDVRHFIVLGAGSSGLHAYFHQ
ncbi:hypothetical protein DSL92_06890 [Billgrantia gudaonensis]|uniref:Uncharacterized protein n=1 Tax=Billgrantia gudaonensis TaxID=376427 RepID=A0A3S0NDS7_9GAMM|nr:hypothetical protein DSL92_06890 [Halomonas gudaonensis]